MDAKSKAEFINSVAEGEAIPCPNCNSLNEPDSIFCSSCGSELKKHESIKENEAMEDKVDVADVDSKNSDVTDEIKQTSRKGTESSSKPAFQSVTIDEEETEEISVFAEGLPEWDVVPPNVMVRRKKNV